MDIILDDGLPWGGLCMFTWPHRAKGGYETIHIGIDIENANKLLKEGRGAERMKNLGFSDARKYFEALCETDLTHETIHIIIGKLEDWPISYAFDNIDRNDEISGRYI